MDDGKHSQQMVNINDQIRIKSESHSRLERFKIFNIKRKSKLQ